MPFLDKPPLVFWIQASLLQVLPASPLVARAPSLLGGATWVMFVFLFAVRLATDRRVAWFAAGLATTSAAAVWGSRFGPTADMPLAACVAAALYAALVGLQQGAGSGDGRPGVRASVGLGLAVGLGLLAKGPLVVAVPGLVALGWLACGAAPGAVWRTMFSPLAWLSALLVAAPWYVLVEQAHPGWIRHFVVYEHFGRFGAGDHRDFAPPWFYVPVVLLYLLPFTGLLFPPAPRGAGPLRRLVGPIVDGPWSPRPWRQRLDAAVPIGRGGRPVPAGRLAFTWFLLGFLLYSVSTRKLLNYLLPAALPLLVLAAAQLADVADRSRRWLTWLPLTLGLGAIAGATVIGLGLWFPLATGALPTAVEAPRYAALLPWMAAGGLVLASAALVAARVRRPQPWLILGAALFWWLLDLGLARAPELGAAGPLAQAIEREADGATAVVTYRRYPQGLGLHRRQGVWIAGGDPHAFRQREIVEPFATSHWRAQPRDAAGRPLWTGRGGLLTRREFRMLWDGAQRVVVVCRYAEIRPLGGRILSGPHAGAARTDLFVIDNGRD
jgi:4-amino-4-deoxy-L-arabinose transferase-like glycosyltransferase